MARKKKAAKRDEGKTRVELRLDDDLSDKLKDLADEVGVSVNQLMQGVIRWTVENAHPGEPEFHPEHGYFTTNDHEGCVWFGEQPHEVEKEDGAPHHDPGFVAFWLDFTERRIIRRDDRGVPLRGMR